MSSSVIFTGLNLNTAANMEGGATIKPFLEFDATEDAKVLRKAMKGFGTDEDAIIEVLTNRTNCQRQEIAEAFNAEFKRDLIKDLISEISGNFRKLIIALMDPPIMYLAKECKNAVTKCKKGKTNFDAITEILCTRSNEEIQQISEKFEEAYGLPLLEAVKAEITDDYKKMLVPMLTVCLNGERDEEYMNLEKATEQAKAMNAALVKADWESSDEEAFIALISGQPLGQLRLIKRQYDCHFGNEPGHSLEEMIEKKFSEVPQLQNALLTLVKFTKGLELFLAEKIENALLGIGGDPVSPLELDFVDIVQHHTRDDCTLIRIIVSRSELDLETIRGLYEETYDKNLAEAVTSKTSGDYRKTILSIIQSSAS